MRVGGHADQPRDPLRPHRGGQQHDPTANGRADQDLRPFAQRVEHRDRVLGPAPDGAVLEAARRGAVSQIVEAQEILARGPGVSLQRERLGAGHVRHEPAQKDQPRRTLSRFVARGLVVGDGGAVRP